MMFAPLLLALVVGQISDPYVRSRVQSGDPSTQCLYWTANRLTWHQNRLGNPQTPGDSEFEAVRRSFASWQEVFTNCGNLELVEGPLVDEREVGYSQNGENRNIVLFRMRRCAEVAPNDDACWEDDTCANAYDCWDHGPGTIGITLTTYDERSGIIYDSDIELNAAGFTFTTSDGGACGPVVTADCVSTDVQNTVTHEVGHFLGLDHTDAVGSTMNPRAPPGELSKRVIDNGSALFVCEAYPKGRASQSCLHPSAELELGQKNTGCASTGAGAWLPALVGWAMLAVRRRGGARA